jgi:hypothetical protein
MRSLSILFNPVILSNVLSPVVLSTFSGRGFTE